MKRIIIRFWYVPIVVVVMLMLSLIVLNLSSDQKNQPSKSEAMKVVREERTFHTIRKGGTIKEVSPQWIKSDSLYAHASVAELIQFASKHKDAIERLIAFRALLMKDPHEAANLTISEVDDITLVGTSDGICGQAESVSDIRISMMLGNRVRSKVTIEDSIRIDSAVLYSVNSSKLNYPHELYRKLPAKPEYENRLRQLYKQDKRALIALAKYHKEQDKQEIIRLLSKIEHDRAFDYRDTVLIVFDALINFNTRWSYNVIDQALSTSKKKNKDYYSYCWYFHLAYDKNPHPLYKTLLKKYPLHE
ncbi:hypothetical protein [Prevotella sp. P6B4]|uniref:hypothetical protein n=1 Tax=Prevotella sp. P6B4 TaxID=1410614 RepID=UPI00048B5163|nr:hypothetical protein [Prevotella sp. P6B4]